MGSAQSSVGSAPRATSSAIGPSSTARTTGAIFFANVAREAHAQVAHQVSSGVTSRERALVGEPRRLRGWKEPRPLQEPLRELLGSRSLRLQASASGRASTATQGSLCEILPLETGS